MKPRTVTIAPQREASRAFTLIELIGVLAIMAIMASVLAPNALRLVDRAAADAERASLRALSEQTVRFLAEKNYLPGAGPAPTPLQPLPSPPNWCIDLSGYSNLSAYDIWKNRRGAMRGFVLEAGSPTPRAILFSNLRPTANLSLPSGSFASAAFAQMWNTQDGMVPPSTAWNGWGAWNAQPRSGEYLVIERITFGSKWRFTVTLNNASATSTNPAGEVSQYRIFRADGRIDGPRPCNPGGPVTEPGLRPGERIELYDGSNVNYVHVVGSSDVMLQFDGVQWRIP